MSGGRLSSNSVVLNGGYFVGQRLRLDFGIQYQPAIGEEGSGSRASAISAGVGLYLLPNLFVHGGVSQLSVLVADTVGVTEGKGGPGFMVGAGYDLFVARHWAITAYANYFTGSIPSLERNANLSTVTTAGHVTALNAGVAVTWMRGAWVFTRRGTSGGIKR